jgi:toxin ParE1/3/4
MPTLTTPLKLRPRNSPGKVSDLPRLRMLPSAKADLVNILEYITRESGHVTVGRQFVEVLRQHCRKLAALPGTLGRARPELRADIRSVAFKRYVIFFRYVDDTFEVVNIIEGHRDIEALYKDFGTRLKR